MKNLFFACICIVAFVCSAKAQNTPILKQRRPAFSDPVQADIKTDTSVKALTSQWRQDIKDITAENLTKAADGKTSVYDAMIYSNMPVADTHNSKHRMPVAKPGDANLQYTMPVKRIEIMDIVRKQRLDPGVKF